MVQGGWYLSSPPGLSSQEAFKLEVDCNVNIARGVAADIRDDPGERGKTCVIEAKRLG